MEASYDLSPIYKAGQTIITQRPCLTRGRQSDAATPIAEWKIMPADSNAESEEVSSQSSQSVNEPEPIVLSSDDSYNRPNQSLGSPGVVHRTLVSSNTITESDIATMFSAICLRMKQIIPLASRTSIYTSATLYTCHSDDLYPQIKQRNQDKGTTSKAKQLQPSTSAAASSVDSSKGRSKYGGNQKDLPEGIVNVISCWSFRLLTMTLFKLTDDH